jgi:predicted alpha-1,2-mannosidase
MRLLSYVNPLQGTDSSGSLSRGSTMPIVAMPFGMAHWTLQTDDGWGWQFQPRSPKLQGVRLTHQPSPWMGDYGAFVVMPQSGARALSTGRRATTWRLDKTTVKPHRMRAELVASGVILETAPTERGAVFRFRFPDGADSRLILEGVKGETHFELRSDGLLVGWTRGNSGGVPANFACYFVARLTVPIPSWTTFRGDDLGPSNEAKTGDALGVCLELGRAREVTMRVGTSFISIEQAILNLEREIGRANLDEIASRAEAAWEKTLGQIEIETDDEVAKKTFYSCLYRTKLFPRTWHEIDPAGKTVHFSPYDGQVHDGPLYADTGFWDTFRTQHPLLTLLEPARQAEMLRGWVNAYHESGWLPQWPSPGHRVSMPGTHLDATIADAVAKGIRNFDIEAALKGMLRHADGPARGGPVGAGRNDIESYLKYGYSVSGGAVAQTLDYAYDDWAIAQTATALGQKEVANRLLGRALNYQKLYDPGVGFMRARKADGGWVEPFDEFSWGGPYVEGGPWQSSWAVQHDAAGLMSLMGGEVAFAKKLDQMLATPPYFHVGGYGVEIHEMTEMAIRDFGQYAHGNQPVHHVLYLYLAAGRPWRAQKEIRRVLDTLYSPDGFAGDEDNGEMAAWYVLSSLGLYPHCPGRPEWALGSPLFKRTRVHLPNGRTLTIDAPENSAKYPYVTEVSLRGHVIPGTVVGHQALLEGGTLHFHMSTTPSMRVTPMAGRPGSMSPYK